MKMVFMDPVRDVADYYWQHQAVHRRLQSPQPTSSVLCEKNDRTDVETVL